MVELTTGPTASVNVPELAFGADMPLVATLRASHVETLHRGTVAVCLPSGRLQFQVGDATQQTYLRSSAKPFQSLALITTGTVEKLRLSSRDIAISCASHSGETDHAEAVNALLDKAGLGPEFLQCGVHAPLNPTAASALLSSSQAATAVHNNCSGKHTGMLAVCKAMGWPLDSYMRPDHPLQVLNRSNLAACAGIEPGEIDIGVDGCGVPAFYLSVRSAATAFARLATGEFLAPSLSEATRQVREAMMEHPFLVAGSDRFDTELMTAGKGAIACKGGAQGFQGVALLEQRLGLALKITDGSSTPIPAVVLRVLDAVGSIGPDSTHELARYRKIELKNHAGTIVGSVQPVFSVDGLRA